MIKSISKTILAGLFFLLLAVPASAQKMNSTLYFLQNAPQANQLNPA
jgi:hypothetical protein